MAVPATVALLLPLLVMIALATRGAFATTITFKNQCVHNINLFNNTHLVVIPRGGPALVQNVHRPALMWRHGYSDQATRT